MVCKVFKQSNGGKGRLFKYSLPFARSNERHPFDDSMKDESYKFRRGVDTRVTWVASSYFTP